MSGQRILFCFYVYQMTRFRISMVSNYNIQIIYIHSYERRTCLHITCRHWTTHSLMTWCVGRRSSETTVYCTYNNIVQLLIKQSGLDAIKIQLVNSKTNWNNTLRQFYGHLVRFENISPNSATEYILWLMYSNLYWYHLRTVWV